MRARVAVATAAVMAVSVVGVAVAAAPPRLAGTFKVRIKITHAVNVGQHAGSTGVVKWKFTPNCTSGGCTTILKRHTLDGRVATAKLLVVAGGYKEKVVDKQDCVSNRTGKVLARKAYTLTTILTIHPTKVVGGAVTAFTGTDKTTSKVTALGRSRGCGPGSETWTLHSVG